MVVLPGWCAWVVVLLSSACHLFSCSATSPLLASPCHCHSCPRIRCRIISSTLFISWVMLGWLGWCGWMSWAHLLGLAPPPLDASAPWVGLFLCGLFLDWVGLGLPGLGLPGLGLPGLGLLSITTFGYGLLYASGYGLVRFLFRPPCFPLALCLAFSFLLSVFFARTQALAHALSSSARSYSFGVLNVGRCVSSLI